MWITWTNNCENMPVHWIYYHRLKSPTNYGIIVLRRVDMWNNPITVSYCKIGESLMATRNNCVVADKKCINQTHFILDLWCRLFQKEPNTILH